MHSVLLSLDPPGIQSCVAQESAVCFLFSLYVPSFQSNKLAASSPPDVTGKLFFKFVCLCHVVLMDLRAALCYDHRNHH